MGLNSEKDSGDEHKKDDNNQLYFNMTEIKWTTLIATATAIPESEWNQVIEEANTVFKTWRKLYLRGTELDWSVYSVRQGIRSRPSKHVWEINQSCLMVLVPHDQYQRVMETQTDNMKDQEPVIKTVTHD